MPPQWLVVRRGDTPTDCEIRPKCLVCFLRIICSRASCTQAVVWTVIRGHFDSTMNMARPMTGLCAAIAWRSMTKHSSKGRASADQRGSQSKANAATRRAGTATAEHETWKRTLVGRWADGQARSIIGVTSARRGNPCLVQVRYLISIINSNSRFDLRQQRKLFSKPGRIRAPCQHRQRNT